MWKILDSYTYVCFVGCWYIHGGIIFPFVAGIGEPVSEFCWWRYASSRLYLIIYPFVLVWVCLFFVIYFQLYNFKFSAYAKMREFQACHIAIAVIVGPSTISIWFLTLSAVGLSWVQTISRSHRIGRICPYITRGALAGKSLSRAHSPPWLVRTLFSDTRCQ